MSGVSATLLRSWMACAPRSDSAVCRLCSAEADACSGLSRRLYIRAAGFRGTLAVREILNSVLQTKDYDEVSLPQNICDLCLDTTLHFFMFWQKCRQTEKKLASALATLSNRVSNLHSQVLRKKKSKYCKQTATVLSLNKKTIEYFNLELAETNKVTAACTYINRTLSSNPKIQGKIGTKLKTKVIRIIKDNGPMKLAAQNARFLKFYCSYCPESFSQKTELTCHLKRHHHIVDIAECTECGKKFKTIQLLKKHVTCHKVTNAKCFICQHNFESPSSLETHINEKHTEYKFQCPDCHELFLKERDIIIHQWNTHKIGYEYYCKVCGKKFTNYYAVKSHEELHDDFDCDRCGEKFNTRLKLSTHIVSCLRMLDKPERSIAEVDRYTCNYCKKHFYRKATLRQHILNLHLFPKQFKCPNCDKRFSTRTQLEAHLVVHTRERTEQCSVCGKYFVTKYALVYHMRLHTGERPYPCDVCDERFLSASRRMAHMRRKHIGRTEQCKVCSKCYFTGYALKRHMQRHFDPRSTLFESN